MTSRSPSPHSISRRRRRAPITFGLNPLGGSLPVVAAAVLMVVAAAPSIQAQSPDTVDVLFIGNSYVYYNNMADQLQELSQALDGPVLRTDHHLHGGFSLRRHLDDGHLPEVFAQRAPDGDPWDRVVVQEHSRLGVAYADADAGTIGDARPFHEAAREVVAASREIGAEPLFYMTWAKEAFPDQIDALADAYLAIGRRLGVPVAPVGRAWERVRTERPDLHLFTDDGSHPNPTGSYLIACVMYTTLTGLPATGAPAELSGIPMTTPGVPTSDTPEVLVSLDAETARYLQDVAWETVTGR